MISLGITGVIFAMLGHLFSGVIVMVATQLLVGVSCLLPIFINFTFIDYDVLPVLYVISIFSGVLWSVDFSYRRRLLGDTLPSKIVGSGVSLDVLSSHATRLLGMVFGGLILSIGDENLIFLFLAGIYILSTFLYFGKKDPIPFKQGVTGFSTLFKKVIEHAFKNIPVLTVLALTPIFNVFVLPFFTLISLLFLEKFRTNELEAGIFSSLEAIGALVGGVLISIFYPKKKVMTFCTMLFILLISVLFTSLCEIKYLIVIFIFFTGFASSCYSALQSSIIYTFTEPNLRSATLSVLTVSIGTGFLGAVNVAWLGVNLSIDQILMVMSIEGIACGLIFLILVWSRAKYLKKAIL
jgi:MFS family permease